MTFTVDFECFLSIPSLLNKFSYDWKCNISIQNCIVKSLWLDKYNGIISTSYPEQFWKIGSFSPFSLNERCAGDEVWTYLEELSFITFVTWKKFAENVQIPLNKTDNWRHYFSGWRTSIFGFTDSFIFWSLAIKVTLFKLLIFCHFRPKSWHLSSQSTS